MIEKLKYATEFLKQLTWTRNFQIAVLLLTLLLMYGLFENRQSVYASLRIERTQTVGKPVDIRVGRENRELIKTVVYKSDLIIAIQVIETNFPKNQKRTSHFEIEDKRFQELYEEYLFTKLTDVPLFTNDETQNMRTVALINGQFICVDVKDTIAPKVYPGVERIATTMCSISVPPIYGQFSGYIVAYLKRKPQPEEVDQLRVMLNNVSTSIYEKDIK